MLKSNGNGNCYNPNNPEGSKTAGRTDVDWLTEGEADSDDSVPEPSVLLHNYHQF
jgi:hypothetical protein